MASQIFQDVCYDSEITEGTEQGREDWRHSQLEEKQESDTEESFTGWQNDCTALPGIEEAYRENGYASALALAAAKCSMQFVFDRNESDEGGILEWL